MMKSGSVTKKHKINEFEQGSPPKKAKKNSFRVLDIQDDLPMSSKKTKNSQGFGLENKNIKPSALISTYNPQQNPKKGDKISRKHKAQEEEISQPKFSKKQKLNKSESNVKINIVNDGSAISNKNKSSDVSISQGQINLTKNQKRKLNKKKKIQAKKSESSETLTQAQKSSPEKTAKINLLTKSQARRVRRNKKKETQFTNGSPLTNITPKKRQKLLNQRKETEKSNESMTEDKKVDTIKQKKNINRTIIKQKEQIEDGDDNESEDEESDYIESEDDEPDNIESEDDEPDNIESEDDEPDNIESEDEEPDVKKLKEEDDNEDSDSEEINSSSDEVYEGNQEGSEATENNRKESDADESIRKGSEDDESSQNESSDDNVDVEETSEDESSDYGNTEKAIKSNAEDVSESSDDEKDTSNGYITKKNSDQFKKKPFEREQYPTSSTKVVLKDLPENVTEEMIRETFSFVGNIKSVSIPWDRNQDKPKQFAFMELADKDSAQKVVELSKIAKVGDSVIFIKEYVDYPEGSRGRGGSRGRRGFRGSPGRGGGFRGDRGGFRGSPGRGGGFRGSRGGDRDFRGSFGRGGGFRGSRGGEGGGFRGSRGRDRRSESSTGFRGSKRGGGGRYSD